MAPTVATRTLLAAMLGIALVGGVDAARSEAWDLVAILGAMGVGLIWLVASTSVRRPLVPVRADLVRWLSRRSALSGETPSAVADRAIAAYRSGMTQWDEQDDARGAA